MHLSYWRLCDRHALPSRRPRTEARWPWPHPRGPREVDHCRIGTLMLQTTFPANLIHDSNAPFSTPMCPIAMCVAVECLFCFLLFLSVVTCRPTSFNTRERWSLTNGGRRRRAKSLGNKTHASCVRVVRQLRSVGEGEGRSGCDGPSTRVCRAWRHVMGAMMPGVCVHRRRPRRLLVVRLLLLLGVLLRRRLDDLLRRRLLLLRRLLAVAAARLVVGLLLLVTLLVLSGSGLVLLALRRGGGLPQDGQLLGWERGTENGGGGQGGAEGEQGVNSRRTWSASMSLLVYAPTSPNLMSGLSFFTWSRLALLCAADRKEGRQERRRGPKGNSQQPRGEQTERRDTRATAHRGLCACVAVRVCARIIVRRSRRRVCGLADLKKR